MQYTFDYDSDRGNPDKFIKLQYTQLDLEEAAKDLFLEDVEHKGLDKAIAQISEPFFDEIMLNYLAGMKEGINIFWSHLFENCSYLEFDTVIARAQQNAIDEYNGV